MPEESWGSDCHEEEARAGIAALGGGVRGAFYSPAPARGLARLPFCGSAAISRSRGCRLVGVGPATARRAAPGSEGGRVAFVLRLRAANWAQALSRPAPDTRRVGTRRVNL